MKKNIVLLLCIVMIFTMCTACGKKETTEPVTKQTTATTEKAPEPSGNKEERKEQENTPEEIVSELPDAQFGGGTVKELKLRYGVEENMDIKPFYNVEQNTEFTFHFNSYVNPFTAITVHTDSKCELNSMVYQYNFGYSTGSGIDVVVKPYNPVLNTNDENKLETGNWGYAPIYYLRINYDLYSIVPEKLETPIIVPFTVKNTISTPNVEGFVTSDGSFGIRWNKVENAVKYNIYSAFSNFDGSEDENYSRAELGYIGDFLDLVTTVDANTLEFYDFHNDGTDNVSYNGDYLMFQNFYSLDNYYVTAVDSEGNESFYSFPVEAWKYYDRLPYYFDSFKGFTKNEDYKITSLPESVSVNLKNNETAEFPIRYEKISEEYGHATYKYYIIGTRLTGKVELENENKDYPETIETTKTLNVGFYNIKTDSGIIPDVNVRTISDDSYNNSNINLGKVTKRSTNGLISYTREMAMVRADIENARIYRDGVYGENTPITILYDNPTFIAYFNESGNQVGSSEILGTYKDVTMDGGSGNGNKITTIFFNGEVLYKNEESGEEVSVPIIDNSQITREDYEIHEPPAEVTSENVVQEQIISTEREVAEAEEQPVPAVSYPIFADSAEEEYIALHLVNAEKSFDISGFPKLLNIEYCCDVIEKVIYQNPYILGLSSYGVDINEKIITADYVIPEETIKAKQLEMYKEANNIIDSIIDDRMSTEEKIYAIWTYLEENTVYDYEACEAAEENDFTVEGVKDYMDSFDTYGILVNKIGVCQSYAMTMKLLGSMAGVDVMTITGFLNKNLPHAWNVVKIGNNWYWIDTTNHVNTSGIPYMLYQTSSDYAAHINYVIDSSFALDADIMSVTNGDNSHDYYAENDLLFDNIDDGLARVVSHYLNNRTGITVKIMEDCDNPQEIMNYIGQFLYNNGVSIDEISNLSLVWIYNYLILMTED